MKTLSAQKRPVRVLAVDDSAVMRGVLRTLFQVHREKPRRDLPEMELCGVVEDGMECLSAIVRLRPDVVVLDLEMPRMHGLDVLERMRVEEPGLPVIMCSSYTERGARVTLDALALGAADYVMKPSQQTDFAAALETLASQLLPKIAALAGAGNEVVTASRGQRTRQQIAEGAGSQSISTAGLPFATASLVGTALSAGPLVEIVVIAVSTGGPSALETVLPSLPSSFPVPVMVVQHMPKLFTGALAERLNKICALRVREAYDGAELHPGTIWFAPGDAHMEIAVVDRASSNRVAPGILSTTAVRLHHQPSLNHCKPSADYLFNSSASIYGAGTLALVMTGMGADGLAGAWRVHEAGGAVLTQDEATSAVWGMPARVFEAGISREPLPVGALAGELIRRVNAGRVGQLSHTALPPSIARLLERVAQREQKPELIAALPSEEVTHGLL